MRKFKPEYGDEVDLDDPKTYSHLPNTAKELDDLMFQEIGYYYCYVKFWHKDIFDKDKIGKKQKKRVKKLIKKFTKFRKNNYSNLLWYKEQIFIFQDETENMC